MNEKLKEAFDQVQADEELKNRTRAFISQKTEGYTRFRSSFRYQRLAAAFACMALLLFGGHWLYFTPTTEISIDINPSMELGVNRFNRVISFEGYNDDGQKLLDSLDIKYMNYYDAVNAIIESDKIAALLSRDEILTIAVIGTDTTQSEAIYSRIQSCTAEKSNTYCYHAHSDEVEEAHEAGLSYGKYQAFLELQALDPQITADEIQHMTMREIRDRINMLSNGQASETETSPSESSADYGHHGNGSGQGEGHHWGRESHH